MNKLVLDGVNESIDLSKLEFITDNWEFFYDNIPNMNKKDSLVLQEKCCKYLQLIRDKKRVRYFQVDGVGRYYAKNGLSLQNLPRKIRGTISEEFYYDFDIVNCHPVLLLDLFKTNDIVCSYLEKYVKNRDKVINALSNKNPEMSKSDIKVLILKMINNGEYYYKKLKNKNTWIKNYWGEICNGLKSLSKIYLDEYNRAVSYCKDNKRDNVLGRFISCILCEKENKMLTKIVNYFTEKGIITNNAVLCFDGVMIEKTAFCDADDIEQHIKNIKTLLGNNIDLIVKEMETYDLSNKSGIIEYCKNKKESEIELDILSRDNNNHNYGQDDDKSRFRKMYREDDYYWYDFVSEVCRVRNIEYRELETLFRENINRVMFRCFDGSRYIIKISKKKMFYLNSKIPEENLYFFIKEKKSGNVKFVTQSLSKLITGAGWLEYIHYYNDITFDPSGSDSDTMFNTWTGFRANLLDKEMVKKSETKLEPIFDLVKNVWCGGNEHLFRYVLSWFHYAFKYPYKKNKICIILYSALQQVGKGIFINEFLIPYVYGEELSMSISGLTDVVANFNSQFLNKLFVNCDELQSLNGDFHGSFDALKKIITDPTTTIKIKYSEPLINYPDFCNYICSTNNPNCFKIEEGDSRYCVLECSPIYRGNKKYFKNLISSFNSNIADLFFSYCYHMEEPLCLLNIPMTKLRTEMILNSLNSAKKFMYDLKELINDIGFTSDSEEEKDSEEEEEENINYEYNDIWYDGLLDNKRIRCGVLYNYYKKYCKVENEKPLSNKKFGGYIKDMVRRVKISGYNHYYIDDITILVDIKVSI